MIMIQFIVLGSGRPSNNTRILEGGSKVHVELDQKSTCRGCAGHAHYTIRGQHSDVLGR